MRLVRCDSCGAKAMLAASQCPKCRHPLYVRNDGGRSVPLERCRGCDTYYPLERGACRWCAAPVRTSRFPRVAAGIVAAVVLGGVSWQAWRMRSVFASKAKVVVAAADQPPAAPAPEREVPVVPVLTTGPVPAALAAPAPEHVNVADAGTSVPPAANTPPAPNAVEPQRFASGVGIIYARAITWANVRAERDLGSVVIGVILPDSIVEIVESRGGWRRVSTTGLAGWADHRFFAVDSTRRRKS